MRTPGLFRRHARPVRLLAGLGMAISLTLASGTVASAGTAGITQQTPTRGGTLAGTAFSDQLQVSGASGTVTFVQTDGADSVTVSSSGQVSAASTLAAGTYTADGTDSDTNGDSGTWTYTLNVLQPAPSGFSSTVVNVYQSEYSVAQQLGQGSALQSVSAYQQVVSQLSPVELAVLYDAVQQNPEWYQIPALMQTVASGIPATTTASSSAPAATQSVSATLLNSAQSSTSAKASTSARLSTSAESDGNPPAPFAPKSCPPQIPDAAIFAMQIVIDVATAVYDITAVDISAIPDIADIAKLILGAVADVAAGTAGAASIAKDSLSYAQQLSTDCSNLNTSNEISYIDGTTYQTYSLLTTVASAVTQLQSTGNTTQTDVQNVQTGLTTLQTALGQTIASDTQALQAAVGSDTQGLTSQLQTDLTGINQDLTTIEGDESTLSQAVGQSNTGATTIEATLSTDLTKILNEIDTEAGGLTTLITQDNQQIMTTLNSNFATQQNQYEANLKLHIEQALAGYSGTGNIPQVQLVLPASQGGYLNSTPVGVQEVVTDDLNALQKLGAKITPSALSSFNAANAALAAGQYVSAYNDYAACYVAIA